MGVSGFAPSGGARLKAERCRQSRGGNTDRKQSANAPIAGRNFVADLRQHAAEHGLYV